MLQQQDNVVVEHDVEQPNSEIVPDEHENSIGNDWHPAGGTVTGQ